MKRYFLPMFIFLPVSVWAEIAALSEQDAAERKAAIQNIDYKLEIQLDDQNSSFSGVADLFFTLTNNSKPLRIDFMDGKVQSLSINQNQHPTYTTTSKAIIVSTKELNVGKNHIKIKYTHPYGENGSGVYRFKDPADQKTYIYTQFEPMDAENAFPCFDQPDLKAHFDLTLITPKSWETVSNTLTQSTNVTPLDKKETHFESSPLMSTYTFAFLAGPYKVWTSQYHDIPLRLMARQSLSNKVDPQVWFRLTRFGLDFFANYFNYPYPYKKYDQILVPDQNAGAMENIGAVTFNEKFAEEKQLSYTGSMRLAEVLYHEMAHMWFGNLVTMVWWDDLWLNESFATYMSLQAMQQTPWLSGVDVYQFYTVKVVAYNADQKLTAHPIIQPVKFAEESITQFDEITYEKGCSVLQALAYYIGLDNFKKGVQTYIAKHANNNAKQADFFYSLQQVSTRPLKDFIQRWFYQAGVNRLSLISTSKEDELLFLTINQAQSPARAHATRFDWYYSDVSGKPHSKTNSKYYYANTTQQISQSNRPMPDFVLINGNDQDYVLPQYSENDWRYIENNLMYFSNPLARALLWNTYWDQVYRTKLPAPVFLKSAFTGLQTETEALILENIRHAVLESLAFIPDSTPLEKQYKDAQTASLANLAWNKMEHEKPSSLAQKDWFSFYIQIARSPKQLARVHAILLGNQIPNGLHISSLLRWQMILQLNRFNYPGAKQLIATEKKNDHSREAEHFSMAAFAIQPDRAQKRTWLTNALSLSSPQNLAQRSTILMYLFPSDQSELTEEYSAQIYNDVLALNQKKPSEFLLAISSRISPTQCSVQGAEALQHFVDTTPNLNLAIKKNWLNASQESKYCANNRLLAAQWIKENQTAKSPEH